ncbi:hypothetical protein LWI28_027036 [Acer negundo]|uniref:Uncharacterized protein n=1 Tax=Acer negundo TaxID=4023 RepID=A0AAD5NG93_ACENE|nr:hypothetical protein LWI28_027036 [Acer negundo]
MCISSGRRGAVFQLWRSRDHRRGPCGQRPGALLMEQRLCAEIQQFKDEDEAETGDELQFDGEEMVNEDWLEGDIGPMLMVSPDFLTMNDDPKPELVEKECHAAPKVDKEASLGIGDQSAPKFNNIGVLDSGNTAEEHGSAMVVSLHNSHLRGPSPFSKHSAESTYHPTMQRSQR